MGTKLNSRLALGTVQFGLSYGVANQGGQVGHQEADEDIELRLCRRT
jgi:hypothetical protein